MDNPFRYEYKYLVTEEEIQHIIGRIKHFMDYDKNAGEDGKYIVSSLYFDDCFDSCLNENINGTEPRTKYRIRIYNHSTDRISFERKQKIKSMTLKTSCLIDEVECRTLMQGGGISADFMNDFNNRRISALLRPKVVVEYERIPFVYPVSDVRITFDTKLLSYEGDCFLDHELAVKRPVMPKGLQLMEVKFDRILPEQIKEAININRLNRTAYSKYTLCRKYGL